MQKLIMITGEAWTGKTTSARHLYQELNNSAWLDGDDVWRVNPFSCEDERLRNSDYSMAFVLDNYLKSKFDYVVFSSIVLCDKDILERILNLITYKEYEFVFFTLYSTEDVLKERARIRDSNIDPQFLLLKQSLEESPKYKSIFIDTSYKTPDEIVEIMRFHI